MNNNSKWPFETKTDEAVTTPASVEQPPVQPLASPAAQPVKTAVKSKQTKRASTLLAVTALLLLSLIAAGVMTYMWAREKQAATTATHDLTVVKQQLSTTNLQNMAAAKAAQDEAQQPNYRALIVAYNNMREAEVSVDTAKETSEIEAALKSYYKTATLPSDWAVLSIYQMVKPETPPSGELKALVYWPKSDQKPAGFISLYKPKGGEWKYADTL